MANPPNGGEMHKVQLKEGLGKSTLVNSSLSIPMPPGAALPRPPAASGQGQAGQGSSAQSAQGGNHNG